MLDLEFTAEQQMLRQTVRGVCDSTCPLSVVRSLEDDPHGIAADLWRQLGKLDLIGLLLPEEHGGAGMSLVEGVVLYEELGRAIVPVPHFVSAVMAGGALARVGSDEQKARWLPALASGDSIFSVAWLEPGGGFGPRGVSTLATGDGGAVRLTGTKRHVAFAAGAERLVVLARSGDDPDDVDLYLVDPSAPGVRLTQQYSLSSDTQYEVELDVGVEEADRIGAPGTGWRTWDALMHEGIVLLAAQAMGGARRALDITVQYAKDRQQFDKPLGAFQAIAHYLADATTAVDGGTTLVHEAAWAHSESRPEARRLAAMAKLFACQTYRDVTAMAQQVFGGIGFTVEFDIQLYFRRAKALQLSWWDGAHLEQLVAAAVLDGARGSGRSADVEGR